MQLHISFFCNIIDAQFFQPFLLHAQEIKLTDSMGHF